MNNDDLNRQIAQVTGETVAVIAAMGFGLLTLPDQRPRLRALTFNGSRKVKTGKTERRIRRRKQPSVSNPTVRRRDNAA